MLRQRKPVAEFGDPGSHLSEKEALSSSTSSSPTTNKKVEEVIQALPEAVFKQSSRKALRTLLLTVGFLIIGYYMLYKFPWYLLPVGWSFVGFCAAGLFAVGCACGEEKFFNKENMPSWVNTLTGATCMGILLYPFEQFKLQHNNNKYTLAKCSGYLIESPLWFITSIFEFFSANVYWENKKSVVINAVALYAFAGIFFSAMTYTLGMIGLLKYYIMPLIFYHAIMSIFLKVNDMAWKDSKFPSLPRLVEFLSNNANHQYAIRVNLKDTEAVQQDISDAVASMIPSYNLNAARTVIREKFGQMYEQNFNTSTIRDLFTKYKPLPDLDLETGAYCILSPLLSLYGVLCCTWYWKTFALSFLGYYIGGIGITAGYHRLFSHRSYEANKFVRYIMAFIGVSTFQGPILKWCSDHRIHHRFTDTDKDPYNIKRGFFYAHMGWLFLKRPTEPVGVDDLKQDPVIMWQWNNYTPLAVFVGYILPMLIAGLGWGDWKGGFLIGGVLSKTFLHHCTFFINSLAHTWGEATFTDGRSPKDSYVVSLFTFGEGYHNFHHEFPFDYRNGILWYHYDPGKWLIWLFEKLGWAWDLKKFDPELFEKGRIQMHQKKLDLLKAKYDWGRPIEGLPVISAEEFKQRAAKEHLILIDGVAHAVESFLDQHPPGPAFMKAYIGKDATQAFNGLAYNHSNAARNVLPKLRAYKVENTSQISTEGNNIESSEIIA